MKLLIKQRVFSWTDSYDVYDENGDKKYFVKAEAFALGHQLHVYDVSGRELGMVKQRIMVLLSTFDIEVNGVQKGNIQRKLTFLKPKYEVDFNGWRCEGNFLEWDYEVYAESCQIAHISKELFHWGDTYVIDIVNPENELMALMLCVAIDAANCNN